MRDFGGKRSTTWSRNQQAVAASPAPGKWTLTEMWPPVNAPVQRKAAVSAPAPVMPSDPRPTLQDLFGGVQRKEAGAQPDTAAVHERAQQADAAGSPREDIATHARCGIEGSGSPLPFAERIQRAFGRAHDLSTIRAHVGGDAAIACAAIHAQGYATGNDVAFAKPPSLHLAAHEAAHVVQQRAGIQLAGGDASDVHEATADAVAERVVRDESAADLLSPASASESASAAPVQRKPPEKQVKPIAALLERARQQEKLAKQSLKQRQALMKKQKDIGAELKALDQLEAGKPGKKWQTFGERDRRKQSKLRSMSEEITAKISKLRESEQNAKKAAAENKQEAIRLAIEVYQIDTSKVRDILYNRDISGEGLTTAEDDKREPPLVEVGDEAFKSPGWLGSTIAHEVEIHVNRQERHLRQYGGDPLVSAMHEVEAYDFELSHADRFGTNERELADLRGRRDDHYGKLTPKYQGRADDHIYTIDRQDVRS